MKFIREVIKEGFRYTRNWLNFTSESRNQLEGIIAKLANSDNRTIFVSGGNITIDGGGFTITDAVVSFGGNLYHLTGGTFTGVPSDFYLNFYDVAASGYPKQDHGSDGNIGVLEDVFFERSGIIEATANTTIPANSIALNEVGLRNGYHKIDNADIVPVGSDYSLHYFTSLGYFIDGFKVQLVGNFSFVTDAGFSGDSVAFTIGGPKKLKIQPYETLPTVPVSRFTANVITSGDAFAGMLTVTEDFTLQIQRTPLTNSLHTIMIDATLLLKQ